MIENSILRPLFIKKTLKKLVSHNLVNKEDWGLYKAIINVDGADDFFDDEYEDFDNIDSKLLDVEL